MWEVSHEENEGEHTLTLVGDSARSLTLIAFGRRLELQRDAQGNIQVRGLPVRGATRARTDLEQIANRALEGSGFTLDAVRSRVRFRALVEARVRVCMELRHAGVAYAEIARFIHRNHSSVMSLCKGHYYPPGASPPPHKHTAAEANAVARISFKRLAA